MRTWILTVCSSLQLFAVTCSPCASAPAEPNVVLRWDSAALQGARDSNLGAPMVSRGLAIVHTCMYDAWAAYDSQAVGTELAGALRRPVSERVRTNKEIAINFAAYRALADVFPGDTNTVYKPLMRELGYDPNDQSVDIETAVGVGNVACDAVLSFRHRDRSNQLGDLAQGAYSDWTHYSAVNKPTAVPLRTKMVSPDNWQPLTFVSSTGDLVTQRFEAAQWCFVVPFALSKGDEFRSIANVLGPGVYGSKEYEEQAQELIELSAGLSDKEKMIAEYWSDGAHTEQPPGHWMQFGQWVSARDHHTLDDDVKMFFVLSNALLDSGIAAWDMKRTYDSVRPITGIPFLYRGRTIRAWGGPGRGAVEMDGAQWIPYQMSTSPTPPFPDYVSGHSTYSAAAAMTLAEWTRSDRFGNSVTLPSGSSKIEPGVTPAHPVVLKWTTFTDAANEAGMSRRYGGIHFRRADIAGSVLGRKVAEKVWARAQSYFNGTAKPMIRLDSDMIPGLKPN
jgi:hypothetical protein